MAAVAHIVLVIHLAAPIATGVLLARRGRRQRQAAAAGGLLLLAGMIGFAATAAYAHRLNGRVTTGQVAAASYAVLAVVCILWGVNVALRAGLDRLFRVGRFRRDAGSARVALAQAVRAAALYAFALPYLMGVTLVYRAKAPRAAGDDPATLWHATFEPVSFRATDGLRVAGWWIPAQRPSADAPAASRPGGDRTVILCHGFFADKSRDLALARDLVPAGFNVLAIDLRGHGGSAGQVGGFGHAERHEVLGAVRWLRAVHPSACRRVFGVGRSLGAAALLAAAADDSPEGQGIDALALYEAYDDPAAVVGAVASSYLLPPLDVVVRRAGMPVAGALSGGGLDNGAPLRDVQRIWPRPILFVHGQQDRAVPFDAGRNLYDHALQPRYHYWVPDADGRQVVDDPAVARAVRLFFEYARTLL